MKRPSYAGVSVLSAIAVGRDLYKVVWASVNDAARHDRRLVAKGPDGRFYAFWLLNDGWVWTYAFKTQAEAITDLDARTFRKAP